MATTIDQKVLKALAHPLRFRVLVALSERVASPKELAQELGEPLGRVGHHVRVLAGMGAIELVETRPRRGALEHFYRARMRPAIEDELWAALPEATRRSLVTGPLRGALEDASTAGAGTGFDDPLMHVSVTLLELDRKGREEVAAALLATVDRILNIQARVRERGGDVEPTELVMLHFDRPG